MRLLNALTLFSVMISVVNAADFPREKFDDSTFETIFDGKSL